MSSLLWLLIVVVVVVVLVFIIREVGGYLGVPAPAMRIIMAVVGAILVIALLIVLFQFLGAVGGPPWPRLR